MKIGTRNVTVQRMTAGDLAVIAPLYTKLAPLLRGDMPDLRTLLEMWPQVLDMVDVIVHEDDIPSIRDLPLDEAVTALTGLLQEWLAVNGPYLADSVAPVVSALSQTIVAIAERATAGVKAAAE